MRTHGLLALFLSLLCSACDRGETPPPAAPVAEQPGAVVSAPSASAAVPAASASAPAAPTAASASPHDEDGADGVRRWKSWDGPTNGSPIGTPKAWVVAPNTLGATNDSKPSFSSVALRVAEVSSSDPKEVVVRESWGKFAVPASLARLAQPITGLKKGSTALCAFGGGSVVARIENADAKGVTCAFLFMEKPHKEKIAPDEVLPLDGTLQLGAPAHARFEGAPEWFEGFVVAATGDQVWVSLSTQFANGDPRAGRSVHKLAAANVRAAEIAKPLKVGDACLATEIARIAPCTVKKVLSGGLGYTVAFGNGNTRDFNFDRVARRPKGD